MNIAGKLNYIFSKRQKVQSVFLFLALFIGALMELMGVSFITQLVTLVTDTTKIHSGKTMSMLYDLSGADSDRQFLLYVVIALIIVYVVKNAYLLWINYVQCTFIYNNQLRLSGRLIDCYLKKPYTYHLDKNSAEMVRNVMLDSERLFQMLLTTFTLFSEILISLLLVARNHKFLFITSAFLVRRFLYAKYYFL